jgi:hypothetical protein
VRPIVRIHLLFGALVIAASGATTLAAQQKLALGKPDAESAESFTRINSIRELPSGKVLVADAQDKVVQMVDLAAGVMTKVGREGNGPGEYSFPGTLIALPGGGTLLHDLLARRFLTIAPDGKPGAIVEMPRPPAAPNGGGPVLIGGITQVRGYDDRGRIYFEGSPFGPNGGSVDSVAILRWDRVKPTFDTVGFRRLPAGSATSSVNGGAVRFTVGNNKRFTPTEAWGVAADGSIARVFPEPYRVAWLSGRGQATVGAVIPYTPMKVTEADRKEVLDAIKSGSGGQTMMMVVGGGGGGGGGSSRGIQDFSPPPPEFAETKPPFDGGGAVQVAPEGEVWVLRTRPAGNKIPSYDVFDRTGALVKSVSLNPKSRVVGFGKGTVYVVRTDQDDLQYLQRFRNP